MSDGSIPQGRFLSRYVTLDLEMPRLNAWEEKRACLEKNPDWFDADASKADHERARRVCNVECPVKRECRKDTMLKRENGLTGVYAGMMWDNLQGPQTVEYWHRTHKARPYTTKDNKYPAGWSEERVCPWCKCKFEVHAATINAKYCSQTCRKDAAYDRQKERRGAK